MEQGQSTRTTLVMHVAELRANLLRAATGSDWLKRAGHMCDALVAWARIPSSESDFYDREVISAVFEFVGDLGAATDFAKPDAWVLELSLWDVVEALQLLRTGPERSRYVQKRWSKLVECLERAVDHDADRLLFRWATLCRPRTTPISDFPMTFRADVLAVIESLDTLDLPRRASALAAKFQARAPKMIEWKIKHRPESDEHERARNLIRRFERARRPIPYGFVLHRRALCHVLSSQLTSLPITVSGTSGITIRGEWRFAEVLTA